MAGQSTPHSNSPTSTVAPQAASSSTAPAAADSHPPPLTPDLSLEFPRIDYKIGWKYYTGVCFAAHQSHLECVGAARRASKVWRQSIEDTAKRTGRTIEETKVAVDDLCFALAVFDKVWEV